MDYSTGITLEAYSPQKGNDYLPSSKCFMPA